MTETTVISSNLIQGPASLWYADFGAAEPLLFADPGVGWTDLGGTKDGVMFSVADDYSVLEVDQVIYEVERRRTKRVVTVKTNLAEATLDNLAIAINNTAPVGDLLEADDGVDAFAPAYGAIILDGLAPAGAERRIVVRKVLQTGAVEGAYKKDGQLLWPVEFTGHWISRTVKPFDVRG